MLRVSQLIMINFLRFCPDEIPELEDLDHEMVVNFKDSNFPLNLKNMKKDKLCFCGTRVI